MSRIDILKAFETEPPPLDFILPGGMVSGTVNLLTSPGGTGKSILAMLAGMSVCCPQFDPLGFELDRFGKVLYLCLEDPEAVLEHRLHAIGKELELSPSVRRHIADWFWFEALAGQGANLIEENWRKEITDKCDDKTRLIIIDTMSRSHQLDENSNSDMARFMSYLEQIAVETNTAILLIHHSSKGMAVQGRGDEQQSARGASVLVDNARWQAFVCGMSKEEADSYGIDHDDRGYFVRFGISKQNYSRPFADRWYKRGDGGILKPIALEKKGGGGRWRDA